MFRSLFEVLEECRAQPPLGSIQVVAGVPRSVVLGPQSPDRRLGSRERVVREEQREPLFAARNLGRQDAQHRVRTGDERLKPDPLVDSNWADDRDRPGQDRYPGSILDFVFVANEAKKWKGESDVIVRPGDFPDTDKTSDHRPIIATFEPVQGR